MTKLRILLTIPILLYGIFIFVSIQSDKNIPLYLHLLFAIYLTLFVHYEEKTEVKPFLREDLIEKKKELIALRKKYRPW
ncbi:hypothetical protein SRABI96_01863 [Peribacillus sp. Bi96]|uniref:hypothetical protein n=1 Tax=unclassified Peribacillus TaxID=2675266 RepID=UPI001D422016|nr:hypothetical protein [Peribacillus sp. Bi96]CAH0198904.1 hypothetical protein SRABI96_01863 [Peribacillus sp. Bi96]